jgi:anti-sigma factor RsiW
VTGVITLSVHVGDLLVDHALGGGSDAERELVDAHLDRCKRCVHELAMIVDTFTLLAEECVAPAPAPNLKHRLLDSLEWTGVSHGAQS